MVVCRCKKSSVSTARQGCNVASVSGEHADRIARSNCPHADRVIGATSEDVSGVRVEANAVDVLVVPDKDTLLADMIRDPKAGGLIMSTGSKVMAVGAPLEIPNWLVMALVNYHTLPKIQGPQTDGLICGG